MSRHVLFVHDNRSLGGVGAVSQQLAEALVQRGWSVDHFQLSRPAAGFGAMARLASRRGVVLATQNFSASYAAATIATLCARPWVMSVHGPVTKVLEAAPVKPAKRRFLQWLYRRAPFVACSSQASLDSLRQFCALRAGQHVEVIRNTAAPAFVAAAGAAPARPDHRVGFVGRLSAEKRPMLLLQTLRALPAHWQLDVVGTGPLAAQLERSGEAEIAQGRLHMKGLQQVTPATYRRWRVTLLCSAYEGYPLVLLESLASGVPVVATPIAPAAEMLAQHAPYMLARDDTPEAIAQAIQDLAARGGAEVQRDIASIHRDHDPEAFANAWDRLLAQAVGR